MRKLLFVIVMFLSPCPIPTPFLLPSCSARLQVLIYGVLDVISKAVFGLILMSGASTGYEAI